MGEREPELYGQSTLSQLQNELLDYAAIMPRKVDLVFHQSNDEAKFIEILSYSYDALIINPGAWTHTSLAIADRVASLSQPVIEVHLTHLLCREGIRKNSLIAPHVKGTIMGFGFDSYKLAIDAIAITDTTL